jgi:hypothetical protein
LDVDIDIISLHSNYYLGSGFTPMNPPRKMPSTHSQQMSPGSSFGKNEEPEACMRDSYVAYVALSVSQEHDSRHKTHPVDSLHISRLPWIELGMWAQYLSYRDVLRYESSRSLLGFLAMSAC